MVDVRILVTAIDQASQVFGQIANNANGAFNRMEAAGSQLQMQGGRLALAGGAISAPIIAGFGGVIQEAMSVESSMSDVNKMLGKTEAESAGVGTKLLEMSRTIPISVQGLAAIASAGGALGIPADQVADFTVLTAKLGIAFDMTSDQAGNAIAKLRNVFSLDTQGGIKQTQDLGDAINALDNNMAARASDIVESMTRIGGTARTFGITANESAALATSIISLGNAPEIAATAINSILPALQTATGGTKTFKKGLESVGISAEQMEAMVKANGIQAIQTLLESLNKLDPASRALAIKNMFGSGADARVLGTLANDSSQLAKALKIVGDKAGYAGSMEKEFQARSETTANSLQLMRNGLTEIAINIGSVLLPAVNRVINIIRPIILAVATFAAQHKGITAVVSTVLVAVAAFGALATAIGTVMLFVGSVISSVGVIGGAIAAIPVILESIAIAALSAGLVFEFAVLPAILSVVAAAWAAAVPFLPVIAVAAVLAGAAYLIYRNWQPIGAFFSNLLQPRTLQSAVATIGGFFQWLGGQVLSVGRVIWSALSSIGGAVLSALTPVGSAIASLFVNIVSVVTAPARFIIGVWVGIFQGLWSVLAPVITPQLNALSSAVTGKFNELVGTIGGILAKTGNLVSSAFAPVEMAFNVVVGFVRSQWVGLVGEMSQAGGAIASFFAPVGVALQEWGAWFNLAWQRALGMGIYFQQLGGYFQGVANSAALLLSQVGAGIVQFFAPAIGTFQQISAKVQEFYQALANAGTSGQALGQAIGQWLGQGLLFVGSIINRANELPGYFAEIGNQVYGAIQSWVSGMFASGQALIGQFIAGIQSRIGEAIAPIANMAQQVRNYLPFSPARVGPLSDIDQINLAGTIAQGITPEPVLNAIASLSAAARGALGGILGQLPAPSQTGVTGALATGQGMLGGLVNSLPAPLAQPLQTLGAATGILPAPTDQQAGVGVPPPPVSSQGGSVVVNYNPTINLGSGTPEAQQASFREELRRHKDELARLIADVNRDKARVAY